jgi:hypothetical protein
MSLATLEKEIYRQMQEKLVKKSPQDKKVLSDDVLFFPRQKIRVHKERRNYRYSKALFIQENMRDVATKLEQPSRLSGEALMSGLRSAIILTQQGKYQKLKGVNPAISYQHPGEYEGFYGLCMPIEALYENVYLSFLSKHYNFIAANPGFVEVHEFKGDTPKSEESGKIAYSPRKKLEPKTIEKVIKELEGYSTVSGIEIQADTRLDETIYYLTKKTLSEKKEKTRDEILKYLCLSAGVSKACLTLAGFSWGEFLEKTNSHIGNFVITPTTSGLVDARLIDLYTIKHQGQYTSKKSFREFTRQELECFEWDFDEEKTASFPHQLQYRHFSRGLRAECFQALKTGYTIALRIQHGIDHTLAKDNPDYLIPNILQLGTEEFKHEIRRLTK